MVADAVLRPTSTATSARSFITCTDNGLLLLLTNKNACITTTTTTTSTEPDIWYIGGDRDKAAIAEQIAAAFMAACVKLYTPDHSIKEVDLSIYFNGLYHDSLIHSL
ncbi:MAG TPA: hypothetical protein VFH09_03785 [Nitrososphaera sp.]|nr:hypothetical protein [Nitrososphaera sp.]